MAGYVLEQLQAYAQNYWDRKLYNTFAQQYPLLHFLGINTESSRKMLGVPGVPLIFGGVNQIGQGELAELAYSYNHQFRYVKYETNDGGTVANGGATKVASGFAEDNVGTAETRWTFYQEPIAIRKDSVEAAQGEVQIASIMDQALGPVWTRFHKRINTGLWSGTLASSDQDQIMWPDFIGLTQWLTANNTCARVDRSVITTLNPLVLDASTFTGGSAINFNFHRKVNVENSLAFKSDNDAGKPLITDDTAHPLALGQ